MIHLTFFFLSLVTTLLSLVTFLNLTLSLVHLAVRGVHEWRHTSDPFPIDPLDDSSSFGTSFSRPVGLVSARSTHGCGVSDKMTEILGGKSLLYQIRFIYIFYSKNFTITFS